jgi:haloacid dehalogenase-like hydrolase
MILEKLSPADLHRLVQNAFRPIPEDALIIFDIDSTIMHTGYRNLHILKEAASIWDQLTPLIDTLNVDHLGWNITAPLEERGIEDPELLGEIQAYWQERFFTDEYLAADRPYPGVREFIGELASMGYRILYLTGRDAPGMQTGTRQSFDTHMIPEGELIFKPAREMDDLAFKEEAMAGMKRYGTVVAAVENEPANANLFKERFPAAEVFLFESITSPNPEEPRAELRRFRAYSPD